LPEPKKKQQEYFSRVESGAMVGKCFLGPGVKLKFPKCGSPVIGFIFWSELNGPFEAGAELRYKLALLRLNPYIFLIGVGFGTTHMRLICPCGRTTRVRMVLAFLFHHDA
jgi:hypothetical protein